MAQVRVAVPRDKIAAFCRRWQITELALFGSVLREDFGPESDVDVLVTFAPGAPWSLLDLVDMAEELKALFGRDVDLVEESALRNPFRRRAILSTKEVVYAA
ncbi:MAG TPA: nucleotidyltransferase family protein [Anaerolineae bacterium]|nr:nucleotidyltransferase family protein [Anaerolineae bacterium]HPL28145.1 nucleotidyltransferase family protein [Anaerolineae bacterium]